MLIDKIKKQKKNINSKYTLFYIYYNEMCTYNMKNENLSFHW